MKLIYYRGVHSNFGDELNSVLWPRLVPELFESDDSVGFLGIGTIIGMPVPECTTLNVFTSGIGYDSFERERDKMRLWCVRGPLSAVLLGADPGTAITDGAILSPLVLGERISGAPRHRVSVMPHWESMLHPGWEEACAAAGFALISPIGRPEDVIAELRSTGLLLTESLHGAILADSYGIPWIALVTSGNYSLFKWTDWCLSVGVRLRVMNVPPPAASMRARFGRPPIGHWGDVSTPDEADVTAEFVRKCRGWTDRRGPAARRRLGTVLRDHVPRHPLVSRMMGFHPGRTAEALARAANLEPSLSQAGLRGRHRERLLEQLDALSRTVGARLTIGHAARDAVTDVNRMPLIESVSAE
jgi:succinoglycan biosynthesis protein ExoV